MIRGTAIHNGRTRRRLRLLALGVAAVALAISLHPRPASAQTITEYSSGFTGNVFGVAAGPDGNVWFTEPNVDMVGRITPDGTVTEFSAGITAGASPRGITLGPDGNLWFAEHDLDQIGRITPTGTVTEFGAGITATAQPFDIAAGPDGNLWFTEVNMDQIGRITPTGTVTEFGAGITPSATPESIAAGPDGNLWFTESDTDSIGRITTVGVVTEFSAGITAGATPATIAAGSDGNLWFTEGAAERIGRITTAGVVTEFSAGITAGAQLGGITAGPDGNLWFTESFPAQLGRITPSGVVTEFSAWLGNPVEIIVGPDGNLWFSSTSSYSIGKVVLPAAAPPVSPPVQGETANLKPVSGTVLVKLPGTDAFVPVSEARSVPVGTIVDTRTGVVELTSAADKSGKTQTAQFKYGLFKVTQSAKKGAYTELKLLGPLEGCKKKGKKQKSGRGARVSGPVASIARRRGRSLWGSGSGRFRTSGSRGSGAARGTTWQVTDRCDRRTEIRSIKGKVTARDFVRKRTVILKSGKRYVAPGPRGRFK